MRFFLRNSGVIKNRKWDYNAYKKASSKREDAMKNTGYVALVLAGGKGTRLSVLTREISKPAINFGGVHRLIDFTLSNCKHSNVGIVGIVTQYRSRNLADYIGCGSQWLPESRYARITTLPPQIRNGMSESYNGTAEAILKNADFIEQYNPTNILVLSADHVYKMNYAKMIRAHEQSGAVATIAAINVPLPEASRFGIMITDNNGRIIDFEEKPAFPKSRMASMGVYVFNWAALKKHLINTSTSSDSGIDIGKDIIPRMLRSRDRLSAYKFNGYWKDVGDIYSLWEANMELLSASPGINLHDDKWGIVSRNDRKLLRHKYHKTNEVRITNSFVAEGCIIKGSVSNSIVSDDVEIGQDATIIDSVIMPGARIGKGSLVLKTLVGPNVIVDDYTALGSVKPDGKYLDNCRGVSVVGSNANVYTQKNGRLASMAASKLVGCAV